MFVKEGSKEKFGIMSAERLSELRPICHYLLRRGGLLGDSMDHTVYVKEAKTWIGVPRFPVRSLTGVRSAAGAFCVGPGGLTPERKNPGPHPQGLVDKRPEGRWFP